jgi:hypothetical protein
MLVVECVTDGHTVYRFLLTFVSLDVLHNEERRRHCNSMGRGYNNRLSFIRWKESLTVRPASVGAVCVCVCVRERERERERTVARPTVTSQLKPI